MMDGRGLYDDVSIAEHGPPADPWVMAAAGRYNFTRTKLSMFSPVNFNTVEVCLSTSALSRLNLNTVESPTSSPSRMAPATAVDFLREIHAKSGLESDQHRRSLERAAGRSGHP
ncbi:hypothetical protein ACLOJK_014864 [Asimina triloba]